MRTPDETSSVDLAAGACDEALLFDDDDDEFDGRTAGADALRSSGDGIGAVIKLMMIMPQKQKCQSNH